MNAFLPRDNPDTDALLIDFASTGVGYGMADVAMHLCHALMPGDLRTHEAAFVARHLRFLDQPDYDPKLARRHYELATIDYGRFAGPLLGRGVALRVLGEATQEQRRARAPQRAGGFAPRRPPRRLPREVRRRDKFDNLRSRVIQRERCSSGMAGSHLYLPLPVRWLCLQKNWSHLRSTHSFWPSAWSVPNEVPGLTWCARACSNGTRPRRRASPWPRGGARRACGRSGAVARGAAGRHRHRRARRPRRGGAAADAVVAARRHTARARRPGISLRLGPWAASAVGSKKRRGQQDPCKCV